MSPTTAAKVLLAARGPKPALPRRPHDRRTRILASDVMWSSDSVDLGGGRKLIVTLDECSLFKVGWDLAAEETAEAVADHARAIVRRTKRLPLVWKFDHGSGFMNREFQSILRDHEIVPYPTTCRAPWTNGRSEREHREILNWVRSAPEDALFFRDVDEGMRMLNFVKPRAVLGFRTSAQAYFGGRRRRPFDRERFMKELEEAGRRLGGHGGERFHRRAVRLLLKRWRLYEERELNLGSSHEEFYKPGTWDSSMEQNGAPNRMHCGGPCESGP